MEKQPIYRIIKETYYKNTIKYVEEYKIEVKKKNFFGKYRWRRVKNHLGDIRFDTEAEAVFAAKKLQMGGLVDGVKKEVSVVLDFNYEDK